MKTIIIGAGELGRGVLPILYDSHHEIVVIDRNVDHLKRLSEQYDILTISGDGARLSVLKNAGIETCHTLIATTSNDAANLLACQIAHHFKVPNIVCRCHGNDYFSEEDGITPALYGIDKLVDSEYECFKRVAACLDNRYTLEKIFFSHEDAVMTSIKIPAEGPFVGIPLRLISTDREKLEKVRLAGIIRRGKLIIPHGDTTILVGDELYIAGKKRDVEEIIDYMTPSHAPLTRAVIAGASRTGTLIAQYLDHLGAKVTLIEPNEDLADELNQSTEHNFTILYGEPTDNAMLEEAGADDCDVFISALEDDEKNILCGILARRVGAKKVIVTTTKSEYIAVVPEIEGITTGFNSCFTAVNSVIKAIPHELSDFAGIGAVLQRTNAYVHEFIVHEKSPVCNRLVSDCIHSDHTGTVLFALVFRDDQIFSPNGDFSLRADDKVAAITTHDTLEHLNSLFRPKQSFFGF